MPALRNVQEDYFIYISSKPDGLIDDWFEFEWDMSAISHRSNTSSLQYICPQLQEFGESFTAELIISLHQAQL